MTFWIQHGYGKGDKITRLASSDAAPAGVILSPSSESDTQLPSTSQLCDQAGLRVLLDPETYVYSIDGADGKKHDHHGLDVGAIHWSDAPRRMQAVVESVLAVNETFNTHAVISPTPFQSSLADGWASMSLQLARATLDSATKPVFASVVADASAFADWRAVEDWLDAFTTLDVAGVYLITAWEGSSYPNIWDQDVLCNIFRALHRLSVLNGYEVLWGYSDIAGIAGLGAGADGAAAGWYLSLRHWTRDKWIPRDGGRQSAPRVMSAPLMSPLLAMGEADVASGSRIGPNLYPDASVRQALARNSWGVTDAWYQHLEVLAEMAAAIEEHSARVGDRMELVLGWMEAAEDWLVQLEDMGVAVQAVHRSRLGVLRHALLRCAQEERIL